MCGVFQGDKVEKIDVQNNSRACYHPCKIHSFKDVYMYINVCTQNITAQDLALERRPGEPGLLGRLEGQIYYTGYFQFVPCACIT